MILIMKGMCMGQNPKGVDGYFVLKTGFVGFRLKVHYPF